MIDNIKRQFTAYQYFLTTIRISKRKCFLNTFHDVVNPQRSIKCKTGMKINQ